MRAIDPVMRAILQRAGNLENGGVWKCRLGGALGDDQRSAGFVDQRTVRLVHDRIAETSQHDLAAIGFRAVLAYPARARNVGAKGIKPDLPACAISALRGTS